MGIANRTVNVEFPQAIDIEQVKEIVKGMILSDVVENYSDRSVSIVREQGMIVVTFPRMRWEIPLTRAKLPDGPEAPAEPSPKPVKECPLHFDWPDCDHEANAQEICAAEGIRCPWEPEAPAEPAPDTPTEPERE